MGTIGGWATNAGIAGAVIKGSATKAGGGRLGGTGAGFNTWWNTPKADVVPGVSVGNSLSRILFGKVAGASVSYVLSPARGWEVQEPNFTTVTGSIPAPVKKELQVAAKIAKANQAAQVRMVGLAAPPPHQIVCNY